MRDGKIIKGLRNFIAFGLTIILMTASSMVVFAKTTGNPMGELTVSGGEGANAFVTLNGDQAFTGRTFISGGTISTPDATTATVRLGSAGVVNISPNSAISLSFDAGSITGTLSAGSVKVFGNDGVDVKINTPEGVIDNDGSRESMFTVNLSDGQVSGITEKGSVNLNNGETIVPLKAAQDNDDDDDNSAVGPLLVFTGIVTAAVIYVFLRGDNDENVVSPVR